MAVSNFYKNISKFLNKAWSFLKRDNDTFFLLVLLFVSFLASSITIFGGDLNGKNISTPFFYLTFVIIYVWLTCFLITNIVKKRNKEIKTFLILIIAFAIGLFNILIQTPASVLSFSYFKKIIITFTVLSLIYLSSFSHFNKFIKYAIPAVGFVLSVEIAISYFSGIGQIYANQTAKNYLYFTFANSNAAGINFSIILLLNIYGLFAFGKIYIKITFAIFSFFIIFLIYKTHARNAIISLFLCLLLFALLLLNKNKAKNYSKLLLILISCCFPILVISIYTSLATKTNVLEILNSIFSTQGKETTSRIITWVGAFKHLSGVHFLIGDYYNAAASNLFQTIHSFQNSQIDFFVDEGLLPAISILFFLFLCFYNRFTFIFKFKSKNYLPLALSFFAIFSSTFEGGLFICMNVWYIFGFSLLSLGSFSNDGCVIKSDSITYYEVSI